MPVLQKLTTLLNFEPDKASVAGADRLIDGLKGKLIGLAAVVAPAAIGAAIWDQLKAAASVADVAAKSARAAGVTTEAYQEMTYAGGLSGLAATDVSTALTKLARASYEAANGNKTVNKTFKDLNLNAKDLSKLSPDMQMESLASAISKVEDPSKRAALSINLLGESGTKFASLFAGGAEGIAAMRREADDMGLIIPDDAAIQAEAFNDSLDRLRMMGEKVRQMFVLALLPAIQPILVDLTDWRKKDSKQTTKALAEIAKTVINIIKSFHGGIKDIRAFTDAMGGMGRTMQLFGVIAGSFLAAQYLLRLGQGARMLTVANLKLAASTIKAMLPYLALAAVIAAVVLGVEDLYNFFDGGESQIADWIGDDAGPILENINIILYAILAAIAIIALIFGGIPIAIAAIIAMVIALGIAIYDSWDEIRDAVGGFFAWMGEGLDSLYDKIAAGIVDAFRGAVAGARALWEDLVAWMADQMQVVVGPALKIFDRASSLVGSGADMVARLTGGGAADPGVDARGAVARTAASQQVITNSPIINVDARGMDPDLTAQAVANGQDEANRRLASNAFRRRAVGT